jgi:hypothetical protein
MTSVDIAPADQTAADAMWASYVADSGYDGPLVTAFAFGDSAELADELGLLVLHGPKRATAELVQAFVAQDEPLPRAGDRWTGASCSAAMAGRWRSCARRTCESARSRRSTTASRGTKARVTERGPDGWTRTRASSTVSARRWA